jgi:hypothetical protein
MPPSAQAGSYDATRLEPDPPPPAGAAKSGVGAREAVPAVMRAPVGCRVLRTYGDVPRCNARPTCTEVDASDGPSGES